MQHAGFWLRVVAAIIDGIILSIVNWLVSLVLGQGFVHTVFTIVIAWLYFAYLESSDRQATLGKSILGLKVTDTEGEQISFGKATGRHFAKYISGIIICIGYLMVAFTRNKQGLHDIMAKTFVVKK